VTTLNRTQLTTGEEAIVLPVFGRSEADEQRNGLQFDGRGFDEPGAPLAGPLKPVSWSQERPATVAGLARSLFGVDGPSPGRAGRGLRSHPGRHRPGVPGFEDFNCRVRQPGLRLPSGAQTRHFTTSSGRAVFTTLPLPRLELGGGEFR
jgi:formate dehydrogenase major subunit